MTTALLLLRCVELGLSMSDIDDLDIGLILDMLTEKSNDTYDYDQLATAEDYENF